MYCYTHARCARHACPQLRDMAPIAFSFTATKVRSQYTFTCSASHLWRSFGWNLLPWHQPLDFRRGNYVCWSRSSPTIGNPGSRPGMSSSIVEVRPKAREVSVTQDELIVVLADGRKISVPLAWFPRLLHATPDQREKFELLGEGEGIHWPDVDEDLSVAGLLRGERA